MAKNGAAKHETEGTRRRARGARALQSVDGGEVARSGEESEGALALDRLIHERMRLGHRERAGGERHRSRSTI